MSSKAWYVYVLRSIATGRTYVGATVDEKRRLRQHNGELRGGARSTHGFRPWELIRVVGPIPTQSEALKEERRIKKLRKRRLNKSDSTIYEEKYL